MVRSIFRRELVVPTFTPTRANACRLATGTQAASILTYRRLGSRNTARRCSTLQRNVLSMCTTLPASSNWAVTHLKTLADVSTRVKCAPSRCVPILDERVPTSTPTRARRAPSRCVLILDVDGSQLPHRHMWGARRHGSSSFFGANGPTLRPLVDTNGMHDASFFFRTRTVANGAFFFLDANGWSQLSRQHVRMHADLQQVPRLPLS